MNTIPDVMKGVQLTGHGGPDKLAFRHDLPVPIPGRRDVLIKVGAAGINNTDLNTRLGWYSKSNGAKDDASWTGSPFHFPRIQGADVCGKVVAIGDEVDADLLEKRVVVEPCIWEAGGKVLDQPWSNESRRTKSNRSSQAHFSYLRSSKPNDNSKQKNMSVNW